MMYYFEIYLLQDTFDATHWQRLYDAISQYGGSLGKFKLIVGLNDSTLHYYIASKQDLSQLSNAIDGMILRPVDKTALDVPTHHAKQRMVQFIAGGNIVDLKEKYAVKKSKHLEYVTIDVRVLAGRKAVSTIALLFKGADSRWYKATKRATMFPAHLLAIDFLANTKYLRPKQPKYLDIQKGMHVLQGEDMNAVFAVDTFPYLPKDYYLPISAYDFDKHSFIIGASGSGKSKLIGLFVDRLSQLSKLNPNYRVVVIDPHAALEKDLRGIEESAVVNFQNQAESAELFGGNISDISAATELTGTLFKSLLSDQFNPKLERVLRFSIYVLMTAQTMSLDMLKRFVNDVELRNQVLKHVEGHVPPNITQFFNTDFNELRTKYYNEALAPIISLVDEMQIQPALSGNPEQGESLAHLINRNFLTIFSLNKVSMGEKVVKTIAGLLIQQIFLSAQAGSFGQKVILIIDEVSVVQNPALAAILAEARKYNLFVFLTQQYFGQIEKPLQDAIFTNVSNYYVFRVSEEDARALEGNLTIEIPAEITLAEKEKGVSESDIRSRILTNLNVRECLIRLSAGGQLLPCLKARTLDWTPTHVQASPSLAHYTQEAQLPSKFVEQPAVAVQAPQVQAQVAPAALPQAALDSAPSQPPLQVRPMTTLAELLASQSSSRKPLT